MADGVDPAVEGMQQAYRDQAVDPVAAQAQLEQLPPCDGAVLPGGEGSEESDRAICANTPYRALSRTWADFARYMRVNSAQVRHGTDVRALERTRVRRNVTKVRTDPGLI
jgi:hypothetical protein